MIVVSRNEDGSYTMVSGHRRLMASLDVNDKVEVIDSQSNAKFYVHKIDGRLVALSENAQKQLNDLAESVISRAKD